MQPRLGLSLRSSRLSLLRAGITSIHHHAMPMVSLKMKNTFLSLRDIHSEHEASVVCSRQLSAEQMQLQVILVDSCVFLCEVCLA